MDTLSARESTTGLSATATNGAVSEANERRFYSPERHLEQLRGYGNPGIHRLLEMIRPVAEGTDMLQVLDVFRDHQQEHFFPVLDSEGRPVGLVCERSLKSYVYSRFGLALLSNRSQAKVLEHFMSPCPCVEIDATTDQVLESAHQVAGAEGVLITSKGCYVGFVRASSLVELAHAQQMEIVRQHNVALDQKNREIQAVLQNMRQGICTILPDMTLHSDYSAHLGSILENNELARQSVMQVLFKHADAGPDQLQQIEAALMAVLDQDELMYTCNAHLLPTELNCTFGGRSKVLELHWSPVTDADGQVARLMLVVRDVSQMRQLQQQAAVQQRELQLLGEILSVKERRFSQFMHGSAISLSHSKQILECWRTEEVEDTSDMLAALYRHLHTVKGNARTLGFNAVTDSLHEAEQILQVARESGCVLNGEQMRDALQQIESDFLQYRKLYETRLQGFGDDVNVSKSAHIVDEQWWQTLKQIAENRQDKELISLLARADSSHMGQLMESVIAGVSTLSAELGKQCPDVKLSGNMNNVHVSDENIVRLESVMTHIMRNCLDHGIESAQERTLAGKPEKGTITVDLENTGTGAVLTVTDDGRGLALARLRNKAESLSLLAPEDLASDERVAELIFHSGISTTEKVSMISGRGVGMDAVRSALADVGATINIRWLGSSSANPDYRPFQLYINLPASMLIIN